MRTMRTLGRWVTFKTPIMNPFFDEVMAEFWARVFSRIGFASSKQSLWTLGERAPESSPCLQQSARRCRMLTPDKYIRGPFSMNPHQKGQPTFFGFHCPRIPHNRGHNPNVRKHEASEAALKSGQAKPTAVDPDLREDLRWPLCIALFPSEVSRLLSAPLPKV